MNKNITDQLNKLSSQANSRVGFWKSFIQENKCQKTCELGVYRGDFAQYILSNCPEITEYYMIDPWRNLDDWNKPANQDDHTFNQYYQETLDKTDFAKAKRIVLRGTTQEVVAQIPNESLDFVYIDGDHTLKGISIDLIKMWEKVVPGGYLAGDDFTPDIWQHNREYEPTLVFPWAVYFAEAMDAKIFGLPFKQFLIVKSNTGFEFHDFTKLYGDPGLLKQIQTKPLIGKFKSSLVRSFPSIHKLYKKLQGR